MPFIRPSLPDLISRGLSFFKARLPGADVTLRRSNVVVTSRVQAGASHEQYGYMDWLAQQVLPDTAEAEFLARWTAMKNITPGSAQFAAGNAVFSGTPTTLVPAKTQLQSGTGATYATNIDATIGSGGTISVAVTALTAGSAGNAAAGAQLTVQIAIAGVNGIAVADSGGITGGTDAQTDNALRAQFLNVIQAPPQGGSQNDYEQWAQTLSQVTRVWVLPKWMGAGTVGVTFVCDGRANIIPTSADVAAVLAAITAPYRRPVTADIYVFAPAIFALDMTIVGLTPNTAATQAAVATSIDGLLSRDLDVGSVADPVVVAYADLDAAIEAAQGVTYHFLRTPSADVVVPPGSIAQRGNISYV